MHERQHGHHFFSCDSCSEIYESDDSEFTDAWSKAKRDGWRATKITARDWIHTCADCEVPT